MAKFTVERNPDPARLKAMKKHYKFG